MIPETRFGRALVSGVALGILILLTIVIGNVLTHLMGDVRWWLVIILVTLAGFLFQWRLDR